MEDKKLHSILEQVDAIEIIGHIDKTISAINTDSRKIGENMVFVAVRGVAVDGHDFIATAEKQGATTACWKSRILTVMPLRIGMWLYRTDIASTASVMTTRTM